MIASAIKSVDPYQLITKQVSVKNGVLSFRDQQIDLKHFEKIYIVGIGKAAGPMAAAMETILKEYPIKGTIIVKDRIVNVIYPRRAHNPILRAVPWNDLPSTLPGLSRTKLELNFQ